MALALAAREQHAAVPDLRVEAAREFFHEGPQVRQVERLLERGFGRGRVRVEQVRADGSGHHGRLLLDVLDPTPQLLKRHPPHVHPVQQDGA